MKAPFYLDKLPKAVQKSTSYAGVFRALGATKTITGSGNYRILKHWIKKMQLDTSHFTRTGINLGVSFFESKTKDQFIKDNLYNGKPYTTSIRKGICRHKIVPYQCTCGNTGEWLNKPISLQIHHIDGNNSNNSIDNLQFLCPNCHAQTENYAGIKNRLAKPRRNLAPIQRNRKVNRPSREDLMELIRTTPMVIIGKQYGVSDNAIRKWCKTYQIDTKSISPFSHTSV